MATSLDRSGRQRISGPGGGTGPAGPPGPSAPFALPPPVVVPVGTVVGPIARAPALNYWALTGNSGAVTQIPFPTSPQNGDVFIVHLVGKFVSAPVLVNTQVEQAEDPSNPGQFQGGEGSIHLPQPGQAVWWQYTTSVINAGGGGWGQIV